MFLGNGDGTFQPAKLYSSGEEITYSVAVADVNGDGKPDVVMASNGDVNGNVSVLRGNGDGTFQTAQTYNSGAYSAQSIAVADVNGDGRLDLVVANECAKPACTQGWGASGVVSVLLGHGDGTFESGYIVGSGGADATSVTVADVNGDGKPDVIVANYSHQTTIGIEMGVVGVLLGKGDGTFQAAQQYSSGGYWTQGVAVADVNGDGKPDILVVNGTDCDPECENSSVGVLLGTAPVYTATNLTSSPNLSTYGQAVTFTAVVSSGNGEPPDGETISFMKGTTVLGTGALSGGSASFTTSTLPVGTDYINAVYGGDSNFRRSTSKPVKQVVNKATTTTALASSLNPSNYKKSVTFAASVTPQFSGTVTGTVTFYDGTTVLRTVAVSGGVAKFTTNALASGMHSITAVYGGNSNFSGSTSAPVNQVVLVATTTILSSSPNPSSYGQAVTFTATVTSSLGAPPPDGETVSFMKGTTVLGTGALSGGSASFKTSTLPVGTNAIKAVYGGDSNLPGSTSKAVSQVVSKATTTTALASSLNPSNVGQSVTFTACVAPQFSGTVTGTVTFYDGTTALKTVGLSGGVAKYTTSTLSSGSHTITAKYNGNVDFDGSSASLTQAVH